MLVHTARLAMAVGVATVVTGCSAGVAVPPSFAGFRGAVLVWTPAGLARVDSWTAMSALPVATPGVLRPKLTRLRQLSTTRVVGIAGGDLMPSPVGGTLLPGQLVSFDPDDPATAADLGPATDWFPTFDGQGVWRVLQSSGGSPGLDITAAWDATAYGFSGTVLQPTLRLSNGYQPVAATSDGLAVQRSAPPERPYPDGTGRGPRTAIGGVVTDLVNLDARSGKVLHPISAYTRISVADRAGLALVVNSDPNVQVRPSETIDLDTGRHAVSSNPELNWLIYPQPNTPLDQSGAASASLAGLWSLYAMEPGGNEAELLTQALPTHDTPDHLPRWWQDYVWTGHTLLFPQQTSIDFVTVAAWVPAASNIARAAVHLPRGSYPIAGIGLQGVAADDRHN